MNNYATLYIDGVSSLFCILYLDGFYNNGRKHYDYEFSGGLRGGAIGAPPKIGSTVCFSIPFLCRFGMFENKAQIARGSINKP